jgi:hypothetical protein
MKKRRRNMLRRNNNRMKMSSKKRYLSPLLKKLTQLFLIKQVRIKRKNLKVETPGRRLKSTVLKAPHLEAQRQFTRLLELEIQ